MDLLSEAKRGNRIFKVTFPRNERVYFRLLSWRDFNIYWELSQRGSIPESVLQQSIYDQCVLSDTFEDEQPERFAGVIPTVAALILQLSGPVNTDRFNDNMETVRQHVDSLNSQILMVICRAFPAYKPEDVETMPWSNVMFRLAQAERILMNNKELAQPLEVLSPEEAQKQSRGTKTRVNPEDLVRDGQRMVAQDRALPPSRTIHEERAERLTPKQQEQKRLLEKMQKRRMK